ncbi:iron transporter [Zunongwangia sp. H14]|uniref:iron transporter n=1 Tax=Zunongwangia sp. H14 TaxID=3240792 RepID=UPI0035660F5F
MKIEDNEKKIKLAEQQGKALGAAADYMKNMDNYVEKEVHDYIVSVVSEEAEGTYQFQDGELKWHVPPKDFNTHMEILVRDKHDKRFLPGLKISAKVFDEDNQLVEEKDFPFFWHPFLNHYGANFKIPKEGEYTVEVNFPAPEFPRHDEIKGKRFEKGVSEKFGPLTLEAGRKPHGPE